MDLTLLKVYLKIDSDDLDMAISGYKMAAETYIINAGCKVDYNNKLCEVIIVILVAKMMENPDLLTNLGENTGISICGMIEQLRLSQRSE